LEAEDAPGVFYSVAISMPCKKVETKASGIALMLARRAFHSTKVAIFAYDRAQSSKVKT
jgi:hypothetical protein